RVHEQGVDARQEGGDRGRPAWVARDDLDVGGQACGQRVARDGADGGALADEQVDEGASDGAGRAGDQYRVIGMHRSSPVLRCSVDVGELVGVGDGVDAAHLLAVWGQIEDDDGEGRVAREQQGRRVAVDLPVADAQTPARAGDPEG